jgi:hypothetical protein
MGTWAIRRRWSVTIALTIWVLGATPSTVDAVRGQRAETKSAPAELRGYVERFTGPAPSDCGLRPLVRPFTAASAEELQRSVACGLAAAKGRTPFWAFHQVQGIDSLVFYGLLGTAEGIIFRFSYDSAPCGGPGCPGSFTIARCDKPLVMGRGRADFGCQR